MDHSDSAGEADSGTGLNKARTVSLQPFRFNFTVGTAAQLRAQMGAPAFALRAKRTCRAVDRFWDRLEERYEALWLAALGGRIADDGREVRQTLLDDKGRDPIGELDYARRLFRDGDVPESHGIDAFDRAWLRHLDQCGLDEVVHLVSNYNRFFPVEANLPTDPRDGQFLWMGRAWEPMEVPTRAQILERLPLRG